MKTISSILLVLLGIQVNAQTFYITSYDYPTYMNTISAIGPDLSITPLASLYFNGDQIWDIAFAPDGTLYGTLSDAIIEIDLQNGTSTVVYDFPVAGQYNSLVCNSANEIVALEYNTNHLITIDLSSFTQVSDVVLSESSPGDLTYYKGNLIYQGATSNAILSVRGTSTITLSCPVPSPSGEPFLFFGLSNYTDSCNDNFVYGFTADGLVRRCYIESHTSEEVGVIPNQPWPINGSTSINEYSASACPQIDLDEVNCTLQVRSEPRSVISIFPNPVSDILHIQGVDLLDGMFFTIHSMDGRKLIEGILTPDIDLSKFSAGSYVLNIFDGSKTLSTTTKIIKE